MIEPSVFQVNRLAAGKAKVQLSHSGFTLFEFIYSQTCHSPYTHIAFDKLHIDNAPVKNDC